MTNIVLVYFLEQISVLVLGWPHAQSEFNLYSKFRERNYYAWFNAMFNWHPGLGVCLSSKGSWVRALPASVIKTVWFQVAERVIHLC